MAIHIKDIISNFISSKNKSTEIYNKINKALKEILDEETQKYITIDGVKEREVFFLAESSLALYNFNLVKKELLERIRESLTQIEKIKISIK